MRKQIAWIIVLVLLVVMLPMQAMAASAGVSVSSSNVKVGNTFTATVSFNGGDVYIAGVAASVSYDASVIEFTGASGDGAANLGNGGGRIVLETSNTNRNSLSIKLTFKAKAAGSASISVSGIEISDWDLTSHSASGSSASVTVSAASSEPAPSQSSTPKPSQTETPSPTPEEVEGVETEIDGKNVIISSTLKDVTLPEGFEKEAFTYKGQEIEVARNAASDLVLFYVVDEASKEGSFYLFDKTNEAFYSYLEVRNEASQYIVLPKEMVTEEVPAEYVLRTEKLGETDVDAWALEGGDDSFFLVYATYVGGKPAFYQYDKTEKTLQRFVFPVKEEVPEELSTPSEMPSEEVIVEPEKSLMDRLFGDSAIMAIVLALLGLIIILIAVILTMLISRRKKEKYASMLYYTDEETEENDAMQIPLEEREVISREAFTEEEKEQEEDK